MRKFQKEYLRAMCTAIDRDRIRRAMTLLALAKLQKQ